METVLVVDVHQRPVAEHGVAERQFPPGSQLQVDRPVVPGTNPVVADQKGVQPFAPDDAEQLAPEHDGAGDGAHKCNADRTADAGGDPRQHLKHNGLPVPFHGMLHLPVSYLRGKGADNWSASRTPLPIQTRSRSEPRGDANGLLTAASKTATAAATTAAAEA